MTQDRLRLILRVEDFWTAESVVVDRLREVLEWMPLRLCKVSMGYQLYCRDFAQSSISTNLIAGQGWVLIASWSINEDV